MVREETVDNKILELLKEFPTAKDLYLRVIHDERWRILTEMANKVAVGRWGYNDHGPVHAKITVRNSLEIAKILKSCDIKMSFEEENGGNFEDSLCIIILSSLFHDVGNAVCRNLHEIFSLILSKDIILEHLIDLFDEDKALKMFPYVSEGIVSHMGNFRPTSMEAKIVAVADGLDMEEGRARIPYKLKGPDIHKYSALAIERVEIKGGDIKPVRINVYMEESAGAFQIEQVLLPKVKAANFEKYIELYAIIREKEVVKYL